ncbi:YifB family Mg chelatase-like AAA ATPase [Thermopolyspora sp. NPDC052614]|uniref:YifB family Mg chelatase-like AAA ATPase n=1 Tax=Thermopolyspora sp. NPDC052614 TaxID=3155682 RepID=UPI00343B6F6F
MPVARTRCVALIGVSGRVVEVEADVGRGVPGTHLIGLLDTALSEARGRVRSAVINSGFVWPDARITVSLFPAGLPKKGGHFDLAIAVSLLAGANLVPAARIADPFFIGELGLDGTIRPVRGVLPAMLAAAEAGADTAVVPVANIAEARLVPGITVVPAENLALLVGWLRSGRPDGPWPVSGASAQTIGAGMPAGGEAALGGGARRCRQAGDEPYAHEDDPGAATPPLVPRTEPYAHGDDPPGLDLADVAGQAAARHALEVCAAGGHNLWMLGPPGTGKTMLAERLPTLLPPLERDQALEITAIHSVAGTLPPGEPLLTRAPFMAPHHTATAAAIIGGGSGMVRPGAVSLAHRGVLFLDEAPEFPASVLESLRQPLESGVVTVSRAAGTVTFPARFLLVLASNPCPCGHAGGQDNICVCTPHLRRRYLARLSGPLLDRVDVKVMLRRFTRRELLADRRFIESSKVVAERVLAARERAAKRLAGTPWRCNAEVPTSALHGDLRLEEEATAPLQRCLDTGELSARGVDRALRLSWTLADLAGKDRPTIDETHAALTLWLGEQW